MMMRVVRVVRMVRMVDSRLDMLNGMNGERFLFCIIAPLCILLMHGGVMRGQGLLSRGMGLMCSGVGVRVDRKLAQNSASGVVKLHVVDVGGGWSGGGRIVVVDEWMELERVEVWVEDDGGTSLACWLSATIRDGTKKKVWMVGAEGGGGRKGDRGR